MQTRMNKPSSQYGVNQQTQAKNTPEKKIRAGAVSATIWNNQAIKDGKVSEYKTISFERAFKDAQGNWKNTHSLRMSDIPKAELVLRKAYEYLALANEGVSEAIADEEIVY